MGVGDRWWVGGGVGSGMGGVEYERCPCRV